MWLHGRGCEQDPVRGLTHLSRAAEIGYHRAMTAVGRVHHLGLGVPKDPELARTWYTRAAELGESEALFSLGYMAETGEAGEQDTADAYVFYALATAYGHPSAGARLDVLRDLVDQEAAQARVLAWRSRHLDVDPFAFLSP